MAISTHEQYEVIRESIKANINTIRVLVMQVDKLNTLVSGMEEDDTKGKLNQSIKDLYKSINDLIAETDALLDECVKFAQSTVSTS